MQDFSTILDIVPKIALRCVYYHQSQKWDRDRIASYQDRMLRKLIRHAGRHVPYYRKLFRDIGLDPEGFRGRADMHRIPLLDKEFLRTHTEEFIADNAAKFRPQWTKTSGSTGTPLRLMLSADCRANDAAATIRAYQWGGYYPGKRIFTVRGFLMQSWVFKYNMLGTSLNFDSVELTREKAIQILAEIHKLRPQVYHGYPFSLAMLAKIAQNEGIPIPPGNSVITVGQTLSRHTRQLLEDAYGGKVSDFYGMTENAVMFTECQHGNMHVIEDFAYHELVDARGELARDDRGELVGTSYYNYAMPLIRYRTRDNVILRDAGETCPCGRQFRMVQDIEGRIEDFIRTPEGRLVNMVEGATAMGKGIMLSQYVQDAPDHMYVNIIPGPDFEEDSLPEVEKALRLRVGNAIGIDFKIVSQLEKADAKKTPFIISKIGNAFF